MSPAPEFDQPPLFETPEPATVVETPLALAPTELALRPEDGRLGGDYEQAEAERHVAIAETRGDDLRKEQTGRTSAIILAATGTREIGRVRRADKRPVAKQMSREEANARAREIENELYHKNTGVVERTDAQRAGHNANYKKYSDEWAKIREERHKLSGR
ncbi:MAG: hypothetical protein JWN38_758 [Candidatus Saccharibacteria bacterium]|nr:hypothetical protein [Candidatus Saccharibacteria bacterium]